MCRAPVCLGALLLTLTLGGCASVSVEYEETGVDGLQIPTPSPDPEDFVATIDNPWLPYAEGNRWVYDVTIGVDDRTLTVEVADDTVAVDGIAATAVDSTYAMPDVAGDTATDTATDTSTDIPGPVRDYFAQDRVGNVWWLGRAGEWEAGIDGAQAGLAMPAEPRVGDGWRLALRDGVVEDHATVETLAAGAVVLRVESDLDPGVVVQRTYEEGVGLTRTFNLEGPAGSSRLTSGP